MMNLYAEVLRYKADHRKGGYCKMWKAVNYTQTESTNIIIGGCYFTKLLLISHSMIATQQTNLINLKTKKEYVIRERYSQRVKRMTGAEKDISKWLALKDVMYYLWYVSFCIMFQHRNSSS